METCCQGALCNFSGVHIYMTCNLGIQRNFDEKSKREERFANSIELVPSEIQNSHSH